MPIDISDVRRQIDADPVLADVWRYVDEHLDADAAHDTAHSLRVAAWAIALGDSDVSPRLAIAAALLHDVVNVPKNHPDRAHASTRSAEVARGLLTNLGVDASDVSLVTDAVRDHSFTRGAIPASALGKALQDADRLEALGVIGTFRCIATGVQLGAAFFHADDPWAGERALDDKHYSVDHFFTKLLKLPSTFHTEPGRREAERRAGVMRDLLRSLGDELGVPASV